MTSAEKREIEKHQLAAPESDSRPPTIAVLPFINQSNDPEQDYFADGISEDIISNLSSWKTFPVIARNSSFSFRDPPVQRHRSPPNLVQITWSRAAYAKAATKYASPPI